MRQQTLENAPTPNTHRAEWHPVLRHDLSPLKIQLLFFCAVDGFSVTRELVSSDLGVDETMIDRALQGLIDNRFLLRCSPPDSFSLTPAGLSVLHVINTQKPEILRMVQTLLPVHYTLLRKPDAAEI